MTEKFNYAVARYWDESQQSIGAYMIHGSDIWYGSMDEAKNVLSYIQKLRPEHEWKIFKVTEIVDES